MEPTINPRTCHRVMMIALLLVAGHKALAEGSLPGRLESPDGQVVIDVSLQPAGTPAWQVHYQGKPVLLESRLGFEPDFAAGFSLINAASSQHTGEWKNALGERSIVPDNYREMAIDLRHSSGTRIRILFRAYNEGAAVRYVAPGDQTGDLHFAGERTEFHLPPETYGWEEHGTEGDYQRVKVAEIQPWCERPLTLELAGGLFASLGEADNQRYPRMLLSRSGEDADTLVSALGGPTSNTVKGGTNDGRVTLSPGAASPWRVLVVGQKPGELLERNYLVLNLAAPSVLADTSWIRPGKAMRDAALTTASAKAIVDLAPRLGLQYVGFDAHWYGPDDAGDATHIRAADLDIKEVATYAKAHNVGVCIYVDGRQVKAQGEQLFRLFKNDWGAEAVKIGFVSVGSQADTSWITDTIAKAAENHLVLDIHDGYRPTGNNRTYPNLLTVEGIQGNEHHPPAEHNCTLPFTRYVAGPGDYTVCYMDNRDKTTHGHQLAMGVISFSPLQWLYWYDRPGQYKSVPPEMEFWVHMPTVWDETRVLDGQIGSYAALARRSGREWFLGIINAGQPRTLKLPLSFLERGQNYTAHVYADADKVATPTRVSVETQAVTSDTTLDVPLKAAGGEAVWIEPAR